MQGSIRARGIIGVKCRGQNGRGHSGVKYFNMIFGHVPSGQYDISFSK